MKVLVATKEMQGMRKTDLCVPVEGELVRFCSGGGLFMVGMKCHCATTTFKVAELDMTVDQYTDALVASYRAAGCRDFEEEAMAEIRDEVAYLLKIANAFPVGSVVEIKGRKYVLRTASAVQGVRKAGAK